MKFFYTLMVLVFFALPVQAADAIGIGEEIPSDISLSNQDGEVKNLDDLRGNKGIVIVFYRSADWCPYCQKQLIDLSAYTDQYQERGYNVVGISYDSVEDLKKFDTRRNIEFPLLSDEGSETIKAFGLLNKEHREGSFAYGVPHPAIYVVGFDRRVKAVLKEDGFKERPEPELLLDTLK